MTVPHGTVPLSQVASEHHVSTVGVLPRHATPRRDRAVRCGQWTFIASRLTGHYRAGPAQCTPRPTPRHATPRPWCIAFKSPQHAHSLPYAAPGEREEGGECPKDFSIGYRSPLFSSCSSPKKHICWRRAYMRGSVCPSPLPTSSPATPRLPHAFLARSKALLLERFNYSARKCQIRKTEFAFLLLFCGHPATLLGGCR